MVPRLRAVAVLEDAGPCDAQIPREVPAHCFVVEPDTDEMARAICVILGILKGLATVQEAHVVDEAYVALDHARAVLQLPGDVVDGIQRLRLSLSQAWNSRRTRVKRRAANKETPREIPDDLVVIVVQDGAPIVRRLAAMTVVARSVGWSHGTRNTRGSLTYQMASLAWPEHG